MISEGFSYGFDESKCASCEGACCVGESGYIWVNPNEIKSMAEYLAIDEAEFRSQYLDKIGYKYTIKEVQGSMGYACLFFSQSAKNCTIYPVRPTQCRTFPFWDYFKTNTEEVKKECPGII